MVVLENTFWKTPSRLEILSKSGQQKTTIFGKEDTDTRIYQLM